MSSYFDSAAREVADDFSKIREVEKRVITDVKSVIEDREFPEDIRGKIQHLISVWHYDPELVPHTRGTEHSEVIRRSELIERLHDAFHDLAYKRIVCRFGRLSDKPNGILALRKAWEEEVREAAQEEDNDYQALPEM